MQVNGQSRIDNMDGHDFEYFCAELLRRNGFSNVEVTRGSGDYGVDILAKKDDKTYAIQCKRFNGNVGNKAVQEALSGKIYYNRDVAVVLTNSYFTEQAIETARRTNVLLWNRNKLYEMVRAVAPQKSRTSNTLQEDDDLDEDFWLALEDKSFFTSPSYSQPRKRTSTPSRPRFRIGCLGVILIFIAIIMIIAKIGEKEEEKEREEKKNIMVSAVNRDEDPSATINIPEENPDDTPISVIVNGVCYVKNGDHFEVVGLSDFKLTSIKIQESIDGIPVTIIRAKAFMDENIVSVNLPSSITEIQYRAFCSCKKLARINLPEGLQTISESAFSGCESLQSIVLPNTVTEIESGAFSSTGLRSIKLENVKTIGTYAFSGSRLSSVMLSSSLVEIGEGAFKGCLSLTRIAIPEGVESLGKECFMNCDKLKTISLPETLTTIGNRCFWGCKVLPEIRIPSNVKNLKNSQMFESCYALEAIYIPADCQIPSGSEPFSGCSHARIVYY